jgi:hypothetical protein
MLIRALLLFVVAIGTTLGVPMSCVPGTLADYLSLPPDGCTIGSAVVSEFALSVLTEGSTEIAPADIQVNPLLDAYNEGLLFTYGANAHGGDIKESAVEFLVAAEAGRLTFGSLSAGGMAASGDAAVAGSTEFCFDLFVAGLCSAGSVVTLVADAGGVQSTFDSQTFAAVSALAVRHDIVIDGGLNGSASLESADVRFGVVPEPATSGTVAMILLATFLIRGRRRR